MVIIFDPIVDNWLRILCLEPSPIDTMVITAPTSMTIPSIVSAVRILLRNKALQARLSNLKTFMLVFFVYHLFQQVMHPMLLLQNVHFHSSHLLLHGHLLK